MKTFVQTLFFFLLVTQICFAQGFWNQAGDMPEVRGAHSVVELNGKIYIIGGMTNEGDPFPRTMLVYDESLKEWSHIPFMNDEARWGHSSCVVDGKIYIMGGHDGSNNVATLYMFDPDTELWKNKAPMSTVKGFASCAVIGDKIYVVGGAHSIYAVAGKKLLEVYNTKEDTWIKLADLNKNIWGHSAIAFNGKIYVFGGCSFGTTSTIYNSVEEYDPQTNTWTTKSSMPTERYCLTTCLYNNNIYAIGGWRHSSNGPLYDKVEVYNVISDEWVIEKSLPAKRSATASIALNNKIIVYGGTYTTHPNLGTSEIYEFSFHDVFSQNHYIDKKFARLNIDSILFRTEYSNSYNHQFTPFLIYENENKTIKDSLLLLDDGLHGDLLNQDGIYGAFIPPQAEEDFYSLDVGAIDNSSNKYFCVSDLCKFTTVGPVVWKDYVITQHNDTAYSMKVTLENNSSSFTLSDISARLSTNDGNITEILTGGSNPQLYPDIEPGQSVQSTGTYGYVFYAKNSPGIVNFTLDIYCNNILYWTDSMLVDLVTDMEDELLNLPKEYSLEQNYPNPFNSTSIIKYSISERSNVTIKVFDVLGKEITVLVNKEQPQGNYEVEFDSKDLTSGIYFYKLQAGDYAKTKKMILLK